MFRRRKKEIPAAQRRCRASIIQEAMALIAVANRAERESQQSADAESTDAQEICRTRAVLDAQNALIECILLGRSNALSMSEISTELIQPVLDRSVVGDVAQLAIHHALRGAQRRHPG